MVIRQIGSDIWLAVFFEKIIFIPVYGTSRNTGWYTGTLLQLVLCTCKNFITGQLASNNWQ